MVSIVMTQPAPFAEDLVQAAQECRPRQGWPHFLAKVKAGKPVTVVYFGGSITEAEGWRPLTLKVLQDRFPQAKITGINAAISGTGSDYGAFRLAQHVLTHKPDLLLVEYAVNDGEKNPKTRPAMEGIVRQVKRANPETDLGFIYTLIEARTKQYKEGKSSQAVATMDSVAERYGIPSIDFGLEIARREAEGTLIFTGKTLEEGGKMVFSFDGVHPYEKTGHLIYRDIFARSLPAIEAAASGAGGAALPAPLDPKNWENTQVLPVTDPRITLAGGDWKPLALATLQDPALSGRYASFIPQVYRATEPGSSLTFRFSGTRFGFVALRGPDIGQFSIKIDDRAPVTMTQFDQNSTEKRWRIRPFVFPEELPQGEHIVTITILAEPPDKLGILKAAGVAVPDPSAYAGVSLYMSQIMILGEPLAPVKK